MITQKLHQGFELSRAELIAISFGHKTRRTGSAGAILGDDCIGHEDRLTNFVGGEPCPYLRQVRPHRAAGSNGVKLMAGSTRGSCVGDDLFGSGTLHSRSPTGCAGFCRAGNGLLA